MNEGKKEIKKHWEDDMDLPEGKTCGDCVNVSLCTKMYGAKPENIWCDFSPSRFHGAIN
jgi:hypothetical protein